MEIRSLFKKIFRTDKSNVFGTQLELLNGYNATFTSFDGKIYDTASVRSCVDAIARNGAKLNPKHIKTTSKKYEVIDSKIITLLREKPNELMNAYDMYYKVISQLLLYNNAFIYIMRDEAGVPVGLYPIKANTYKLIEYRDNVYISFNFGTGKTHVSSFDDVIHLKRFFCENDIMGGNTLPITKAMSIKHVLEEGIVNSIKTTQGIKGVLKTTKSILSPKDVKSTRDQFVKDFIDGDDGSGIAGLDAFTDFKPIDINPKTASDEQTKDINKEIKDYFGVSDEIIQSSYNEDQWNAFYESILEPLGIMMSLEFTNKLFNLRERQLGNKIIFEANRLQYASSKTKISIIKEAGQLGLLTINEAREILNLAPIENGDIRLQSLNFINSNIADSYQGGNNNE